MRKIISHIESELLGHTHCPGSIAVFHPHSCAPKAPSGGDPFEHTTLNPKCCLKSRSLLGDAGDACRSCTDAAHIPWLEREGVQTKHKSLASFPAPPPPSCLSSLSPHHFRNKRRRFRLHIPCASKNSSSELSSESLAMLCILHSEILWREGLAGKHRQGNCDTLARHGGEFPTWSLLEEEPCVLSMKIPCCNTKTTKPRWCRRDVSVPLYSSCLFTVVRTCQRDATLRQAASITLMLFWMAAIYNC